MLSKMFLLWVCVIFDGVWGQESTSYRDVNITGQGEVRGFRAPNSNVFTFYNIPYASAPTGENRFKAPLPGPVWPELFQAIDRRIACPQSIGMLDDQHNIVEDCLVANLYVPDTQETNLPVLVIVHSGGFEMGWGNHLEPISLVNNNNIIAVSFNYRVGVHGFLCLGNEDAPGNAGLKDQVALLRWINTNIANFGGNPNDVTVSGCSAGGASVDLLMISSLTDGLMHKVLAESGSNIGPFAVQFDPLQTAKDYAESLNFSDVDDIEALTDFYKTLSYNTIIQNTVTSKRDSSAVFSGCVEKDVGQEMFLGAAPIDILRNGSYTRLPLFYGYASLDGGLRQVHFTSWQSEMNNNFEDFLPADLEFETEEIRQNIASQTKSHYFGDRDVSNETFLEYLHYFSDIMFIHSMLRSAQLQVQAGNNQVYLYEYSFTRSDFPVAPGIQGANHCFQNLAVMDENESTLPQNYIEMKVLMRQLWRNFIRYGNPTPTGWSNTLPTWPPTSATRSPYYSLGSQVTVGSIPIPQRAAFWDPIYDSHSRTPRIPSNSASTFKSLFKILLLSISTLVFISYYL